MKDYSNQFFTTVALSDGTINFNGSSIHGKYNKLMYSKDGGTTWNDASYRQTIRIKHGDRILWKGHATPNDGIGSFESSSPFSVEGNIMSLLFGDEFKGKTDLSGYYSAFYTLFLSCQNLVNAENLVLPATTLAPYCYSSMFQYCGSLIAAPELPATTLANYCYYRMFFGCTSLTKAPELPAETLAWSCYRSMFNGCTHLTEAPSVLPATKLANWCYYSMFYACRRLTEAPQLPATTLAERCYAYMFSYCESLETAPQLPATTLAPYCYLFMFSGCVKLVKTKLLFIDTSGKKNVRNMYYGCAKLKHSPIIVKL